jgi:hypothetical protein
VVSLITKEELEKAYNAVQKIVTAKETVDDLQDHASKGGGSATKDSRPEKIKTISNKLNAVAVEITSLYS